MRSQGSVCSVPEEPPEHQQEEEGVEKKVILPLSQSLIPGPSDLTLFVAGLDRFVQI